MAILLFAFGSLYCKAQSNKSAALYTDFLYKEAFNKLHCMLNNECPLSVKDAVFSVENAYLNNQLSKDIYDREIDRLTYVVRSVIRSGGFLYDGEDRAAMEKNAALFRVLCDSFLIQYNDTLTITHIPYRYDFTDIWGNQDWSKMFVTKLLKTKTGNCHSLPFLYKILAEQIEAKAHLAIAPNHFYIKHHSQSEIGWYNTELTSAAFPVDPWLMASGYIHLDAVVNRLYMEALSDKQTIALCLIDLAKGYQRKIPKSHSDFAMKCVDTALVYYPNYINALLLKADLLHNQFMQKMSESNAQYAADILSDTENQTLFNELETLTAKIHTLGYRKMPERMYLQWLSSLNEEREKYTNQKITNFKSK